MEASLCGESLYLTLSQALYDRHIIAWARLQTVLVWTTFYVAHRRGKESELLTLIKAICSVDCTETHDQN